MTTDVNRKKQVAGVLYGLAAGLAFAVFVWGLDAWQLAQAHGAYYWVKFAPGLLLSLVSGALVGWLTVKLQNSFFSVLLWIVLALFFSRLTYWLSIQLAPRIIRLFNGALGNYLDYPHHKALEQNYWFGFASIVIVAIICGLLENILIDQALFSTGRFALVVPLVVCMMGFGLAGTSADSLANKPLRDPILKVDELLQFAYDNSGKEVSAEVARKMHLGAVSTIEGYLSRERKLILSNFDNAMGQIDILVDFDGRWVKCTTIYSQITMCKPAIETPWNIFSKINEFVWRFPMEVAPGG